MIPTRRARYLTAAAVLLASQTIAGCGEDDPPAVCTSVDSLKSSVADLKNVDLGQGALAMLQEKLSTVQSDLSKVQDDAKGEYVTEVDAVDQAAASVSTSLKAATAAPSTATVAAVGTAVQALGTSLTSLQDEVKTTC